MDKRENGKQTLLGSLAERFSKHKPTNSVIQPYSTQPPMVQGDFQTPAKVAGSMPLMASVGFPWPFPLDDRIVHTGGTISNYIWVAQGSRLFLWALGMESGAMCSVSCVKDHITSLTKIATQGGNRQSTHMVVCVGTVRGVCALAIAVQDKAILSEAFYATSSPVFNVYSYENGCIVVAENGTVIFLSVTEMIEQGDISLALSPSSGVLTQLINNTLQWIKAAASDTKIISSAISNSSKSLFTLASNGCLAFWSISQTPKCVFTQTISTKDKLAVAVVAGELTDAFVAAVVMADGSRQFYSHQKSRGFFESLMNPFASSAGLRMTFVQPFPIYNVFPQGIVCCYSDGITLLSDPDGRLFCHAFTVPFSTGNSSPCELFVESRMAEPVVFVGKMETVLGERFVVFTTKGVAVSFIPMTREDIVLHHLKGDQQDILHNAIKGLGEYDASALFFEIIREKLSGTHPALLDEFDKLIAPQLANSGAELLISPALAAVISACEKLLPPSLWSTSMASYSSEQMAELTAVGPHANNVLEALKTAFEHRHWVARSRDVKPLHCGHWAHNISAIAPKGHVFIDKDRALFVGDVISAVQGSLQKLVTVSLVLQKCEGMPLPQLPKRQLAHFLWSTASVTPIGRAVLALHDMAVIDKLLSITELFPPHFGVELAVSKHLGEGDVAAALEAAKNGCTTLFGTESWPLVIEKLVDCGKLGQQLEVEVLLTISLLLKGSLSHSGRNGSRARSETPRPARAMVEVLKELLVKIGAENSPQVFSTVVAILLGNISKLSEELATMILDWIVGIEICDEMIKERVQLYCSHKNEAPVKAHFAEKIEPLLHRHPPNQVVVFIAAMWNHDFWALAELSLAKRVQRFWCRHIFLEEAEKLQGEKELMLKEPEEDKEALKTSFLKLARQYLEIQEMLNVILGEGTELFSLSRLMALATDTGDIPESEAEMYAQQHQKAWIRLKILTLCANEDAQRFFDDIPTRTYQDIEKAVRVILFFTPDAELVGVVEKLILEFALIFGSDFIPSLAFIVSELSGCAEPPKTLISSPENSRYWVMDFLLSLQLGERKEALAVETIYECLKLQEKNNVLFMAYLLTKGEKWFNPEELSAHRRDLKYFYESKLNAAQMSAQSHQPAHPIPQPEIPLEVLDELGSLLSQFEEDQTNNTMIAQPSIMFPA